MEQLIVRPIGKVQIDDEGMRLELYEAYLPALTNLDGFGYIQVLWWFSQCDHEDSRAKLLEKSPYKNAPELLGTFATRSPERPNPIALSCCQVTSIDTDKGIIWLAYIDAEEGTPVLDVKPYTPSLDRVEHPSVPEWCTKWPRAVEDSGTFDWSAVFNF
ncbi:SAM-dependent methyltransferase [Marasmitruncus massiliensis]|uniref:SAM-dependent methyltransferase n=1 Tax=Marasmitruncus massiliensis TaxID=1944642 RepID=UPI000C7CD0CA|nr:SAM-dependent methyltransferase [Marasmitruncus massiliensis]